LNIITTSEIFVNTFSKSLATGVIVCYTCEKEEGWR